MTRRFRFHNNSRNVIESIVLGSEAGLREACSLVRSHTRDNTNVDSGALRRSWNIEVRRTGIDRVQGRVGSPLNYSIYQEFGTGEFATNGAGRRGGWVYRRADGGFRFTRGTRPKKSLTNAFRIARPAISSILTKHIGFGLRR